MVVVRDKEPKPQPKYYPDIKEVMSKAPVQEKVIHTSS